MANFALHILKGSKTMQRETLGSRLGFILLSAGCAIGMGNVWKFPWLCGKNGGGVFVLFYLIFLIIMGIPVMTMEFSMGRASQKSPAKMYTALAPGKKGWSLHGGLSMAGNFILMMFYTNVSGWMIQYFVKMITGLTDTIKAAPDMAAEAGAQFGGMVSNPTMQIGYMLIVVVVGFLVCSFSLQKGLERVTKYMMLALLAIMIVLAVNSIVMPGGAEGLAFYLVPDFARAKEVGLFNVIIDAMNQSFFTLSLGIGSMAIFGSYLPKDRALMGEAINVGVLDTFVAITSGLIIFPACFAYGVNPDAGPPLIFQTLPLVFANMPGGKIWGSLFFVFMIFAAMSTVFAVFENIVACTRDMFGWGKKKACIIDGVVMFVLSIPCVLGFNLWSGFEPFGAGSNVLDLEDFIVSNVLLPLGSLSVVLFCSWKFGWSWEKFKEEANTGKGVKVRDWMRVYLRYVLPVIILVLFAIGVVTKFWPNALV